MKRRSFLKLTGIAGILAAHRAPAFAQGTKLHIVRWVDFIPGGRRRAQAAGPCRRCTEGAGRGGPVRVHQCQRPAAAHHRRHPVGQRRRHHPDAVEGASAYANGLRRRLRRCRAHRQSAGRLLRGLRRGGQGQRLAGSPCPTRVIGNAVAYRRSWFNEVGAKEFPKTWDEYREVGKKLKAKGKPIGLRRSATPSATSARPSPTRCCGTSAAPRSTRAARRS